MTTFLQKLECLADHGGVTVGLGPEIYFATLVEYEETFSAGTVEIVIDIAYTFIINALKEGS